MDKKLTSEEAQAAEAWMLSFIKNSTTFTFNQLHLGASRELGVHDGHYRLADRLLQRERKAGRIHHRGQGIWEKAQ